MKPENLVAPRLLDQGPLLLAQDVQSVAQLGHRYWNVSVTSHGTNVDWAERVRAHRRGPVWTTIVAVNILMR